ncbi:stalk domain-containing protein [Cohnella lubricantis]|uniref:Copper amine oxidase N-terminal domain-containing protein n=1 Tax=Cohnella lubricantis TaxID=2163172 RepID=A0A841T5Z5_9BACL|nr:stalk domain-containing protein [Cohnella lubricantis]MBB6676734.1 hypothetical protein [Cohnella lubricantis]MBP2117780.1 hypothetical protein [Cohnella lubricantis]
MKHKQALLVLTAAGVLGASAAVGASGLQEKVAGLLRSDVQITVNGEATAIEPVYINGRAYVPVRDAADALGYTINVQGKQIELSTPEPVEDELEAIQMSGVVVGVSQATDGGPTRLEVRGAGGAQWMMLYADSDTAITDESGAVKTVSDIKEGTHITADYGPIIAMSYPGQSSASKIVIGVDHLVKEDTVSRVELTKRGWQVQLGAPIDENGEFSASSVVLNVSDDTLVVKKNGESVKLEDLKEGTKVRAYYGPIETRSLPPQSSAALIVVLDGDSIAEGFLGQ